MRCGFLFLAIFLLQLFRRDPIMLAEFDRKIVAIVEAAGQRHLGDRAGIGLLEHRFRLLQAEKVNVLAKTKACLFFEHPREMLGADRAKTCDLRKRDIGGKVLLQIRHSASDILISIVYRDTALFIAGEKNEQHIHIAAEHLFAQGIIEQIFLFDHIEDTEQLIDDGRIAVKIRLRRQQRHHRGGNESAGTVDEKAGMLGVLILGIMDHPFGNQYNIARNQPIGFMVNKVVTAAAADEIDLEKIMIMLLAMTVFFLVAGRLMVKIKLLPIGKFAKFQRFSPPFFI